MDRTQLSNITGGYFVIFQKKFAIINHIFNKYNQKCIIYNDKFVKYDYNHHSLKITSKNEENYKKYLKLY